MFSYTDDAIVTSSTTGRHLSTVIRRPAAIGPLDWNAHADQVCKVLNELDRNAKLNYRVCYSLGAGLQTAGGIAPDNHDATCRLSERLPQAGDVVEVRHGPDIWDVVEIVATSANKAFYLDPYRKVHHIWGRAGDFRPASSAVKRTAATQPE